MGKLRRLPSNIGIFSRLLFFFSFIILLVSCLLGYIMIVDRIEEASLIGKKYNEWNPIQGSLLEIIKSIPFNLFVSAVQYPSSSLIAIFMFPVAIFIIPFYEGIYLNDYTFLIYFWAPFSFSLMVFTVAALYRIRLESMNIT